MPDTHNGDWLFTKQPRKEGSLAGLQDVVDTNSSFKQAQSAKNCELIYISLPALAARQVI